MSDVHINPTALITIGNVIEFGKYKWRVLDVQGNKALIITENIIEQQKYHDDYVSSITWSGCDLRKYLNGEFLNKFSLRNKQRIVTVTNKNGSITFSVG